ncbi:hypothetical protein E1281_22680 [Actinomadura sp. KC345]|uniref:hypothetical protein n=1 Tax=Actinomadura sp. KC345 TaxID=2530371 RepID=UPI001044FD24|nr:hypothetical protein [Actinomadura sp. KC345]TDC49957.1 hypothetical protein E1281_22680 [Actinomadura sp. KC345]
MPAKRPVALTLTVLVAAFGLTACGGGNRWCEHDATDRKVSDRYCENDTPGYEWESGGKSKKKTKKSRH